MSQGKYVLTELREAQAQVDDLKAQLALMQIAVDENQRGLREVYRERARLVAFLTSIYSCYIGYTDPDEPEWAVVMVYTPAGQMSWHIAAEDMDLFDGRACDGVGDWDGHTTEEKYQRLEQLGAWAREDLEKALGTP